MKFVTDLRLLLLGLWLGAAVFFIAVAQVAFTVLPQRELAGAMVNRALSILNFSGLGVAFLLLVLSLVTARNANALLSWFDRILIVLIGVACAVGQFVLGFMISSVRAQMGGKPIDEFAVDDPLRIEFNQLHEYSVWVLTSAMVVGLIAFFVIANPRTAAVKTASTDPYNFEKEFKV